MPKRARRSQVHALDDVFPGQDVPEDDSPESPSDDPDVLGDALELDDPAFQGATWNVYRLNDDGKAPAGTRVGMFIAKYQGPLDQEAIKREHGGGVYRVIGTMADRSKRWAIIGIDGPRVVSAPPAPSVPRVPDWGMPAPDPLEGLKAEMRELRELVRSVATAPRNDNPLEMFKLALDYARSSTPAPQTPGQGLVESMFGMFERGFNTARKVEGGTAGTLDTLRDLLPPVLEFFKPQTPPHVPLPATTATTPAANGAPAATPASNPRMAKLCDILGSAFRLRTSFDELEDVADRELTGQELAQLAQVTSASTLLGPSGKRGSGLISAALCAQYGLDNDAAAEYLDGFLAHLRSDDDGDE